MEIWSRNVNELYEKWIHDSNTKLDDKDVLKKVYSYLEQQESEICGKCTPCRDGMPRIKELLDEYEKGVASIKTLIEIEQLTANLRSSKCSVGLDVGKNLEVVLENNYNSLYNPVKKY